MSTTKIEWSDATWNPVTGCTPVSSGCAHCYAARTAKRFAGRFGYPADEPFRVTLHPDKLDVPVIWRKPRTVFVCSMGDPHHDHVPIAFLDRMYATMAVCWQHTFQVLTKRADNRREYLTDPGWKGRVLDVIRAEFDHEDWIFQAERRWPGAALPNVWHGVTAEDQQRADERVPLLLQTPAAVRFVSIEPMLGPVDVSPWLGEGMECPQCGNRESSQCYDYGGADDGNAFCNACNAEIATNWDLGLDWIILGGETGPGARPMHPDWARSVRDQCVAAGVPFFFKGWGVWRPVGRTYHDVLHPDANPALRTVWRDDRRLHNSGELMFRVTKKAAGRLLDGREWNEYPKLGRA